MRTGNNLLDALRPEDLASCIGKLKEVELRTGAPLYEPGDHVEYCYFPSHQAVASFLVMLDCGTAVETAMVGREGAVGGIVSSGHLPAYARSNVMHAGVFYRISTRDLDQAKADCPRLRVLFSRYADCLLAQVFQSVACNASHSVEQRAAKWMCAAVERTGLDTITMTQEQLASLIGVGRSYASRVIQRYKADGLVKTHRGRLEVLDHDLVQARACQCNQLVRAHFDTVLSGIYPE